MTPQILFCNSCYALLNFGTGIYKIENTRAIIVTQKKLQGAESGGRARHCNNLVFVFDDGKIVFGLQSDRSA